MKFALLLLALALSACATPAPDIPDDTQLICLEGVINAYSKAANQRMTFEQWKCGRMHGI